MAQYNVCVTFNYTGEVHVEVGSPEGAATYEIQS